MFINKSVDVFANKNTSVKKKANGFLYFERDIFVFTLNKYFVQSRQPSQQEDGVIKARKIYTKKDNYV